MGATVTTTAPPGMENPSLVETRLARDDASTFYDIGRTFKDTSRVLGKARAADDLASFTEMATKVFVGNTLKLATLNLGGRNDAKWEFYSSDQSWRRQYEKGNAVVTN